MDVRDDELEYDATLKQLLPSHTGVQPLIRIHSSFIVAEAELMSEQEFELCHYGDKYMNPVVLLQPFSRWQQKHFSSHEAHFSFLIFLMYHCKSQTKSVLYTMKFKFPVIFFPFLLFQPTCLHTGTGVRSQSG